MDPDFIERNRLPRDQMFVTCIFQALDVKVCAWAMKVTNQLTFEGTEEIRPDKLHWDIVRF